MMKDHSNDAYRKERKRLIRELKQLERELAQVSGVVSPDLIAAIEAKRQELKSFLSAQPEAKPYPRSRSQQAETPPLAKTRSTGSRRAWYTRLKLQSKRMLMILSAVAGIVGCLFTIIGTVPDLLPFVSPLAPIAYEFVLDSSETMNQPYGQQQTRWEIAQQSLADRLHLVPTQAACALRTFGYTRSTSAVTPCQNTQLLVPFARDCQQGMKEAISTITPQGQSPLVLAIKSALEDILDYPSEVRVLVIITAGQDTCGSDLGQALEIYANELQVHHLVAVWLISINDNAIESLQVAAQHYELDYSNVTDGQELSTLLASIFQEPVPHRPSPTPWSTSTATPSPAPTQTPKPTVGVTPFPSPGAGQTQAPSPQPQVPPPGASGSATTLLVTALILLAIVLFMFSRRKELQPRPPRPSQTETDWYAHARRVRLFVEEHTAIDVQKCADLCHLNPDEASRLLEYLVQEGTLVQREVGARVVYFAKQDVYV